MPSISRLTYPLSTTRQSQLRVSRAAGWNAAAQPSTDTWRRRGPIRPRHSPAHAAWRIACSRRCCRACPPRRFGTAGFAIVAPVAICTLVVVAEMLWALVHAANCGAVPGGLCWGVRVADSTPPDMFHRLQQLAGELHRRLFRSALANSSTGAGRPRQPRAWCCCAAVLAEALRTSCSTQTCFPRTQSLPRCELVKVHHSLSHESCLHTVWASAAVC
jgi:hypothetical protein